MEVVRKNHDDAYLSTCAVINTVIGTPLIQIESRESHVINYLACVAASLGDVLLP